MKVAPIPLPQNSKVAGVGRGVLNRRNLPPSEQPPLPPPEGGEWAEGSKMGFLGVLFVSTTSALVPGTCKAQQWTSACSHRGWKIRTGDPSSLWMKFFTDRKCTHAIEPMCEGPAGVWTSGRAEGESPAHLRAAPSHPHPQPKSGLLCPQRQPEEVHLHRDALQRLGAKCTEGVEGRDLS